MKHILAIALSFAIATCSFGFLDNPNNPFLNKVEERWLAGDVEGIKSTINQRLAQFPEDPIALLCGYYIGHVIDDSGAFRNDCANRILKKAEGAGIHDEEFLSKYRERIDFDSKKSTEIRKLVDDFKIAQQSDKPQKFGLTTIIYLEAKIIGKNDQAFQQRLFNDWNTWKLQQFENLRNIGNKTLLSYSTEIITSQNDSIEALPDELKAFNPIMVVIPNDHTLRIVLYKFVNSSYGIEISMKSIKEENGHYYTLEKVSENVGWFTTQG